VATTIKNVATQCAARSMDCQIINDDKQAHHIPRLRDCGAFFIASDKQLDGAVTDTPLVL